MGHVRRASLHRFRHGCGVGAGRRRRHRLRDDQRPAGLRLLAGLHRLRRLAFRGARGEDLQGDGPRDQGGRAGDRAERLRRRADPGRRRVARRLRGGVPAQCARVGRDPADLADHGAVRGRRRVFAGNDRFHLHGEGFVVHVRDRPGSRQDRHARGSDRRRNWAVRSATRPNRESPISRSRPTSTRC